jgi:ABC-type nitrate/sulfonate/bicarbonate transport system substrate-binding protein
MAVSDLAGQSHAETIVALKALGLTSEDVQITQIGGQSARVAALLAGTVDVIPADCVAAAGLVDEGFSILMRLPDLDIEFAGTNIQFMRSFIEENPNTVLAVVAANLEGMQLLFTDEEFAIEAFAEWAQLPPEEAGPAVVDFKGVAQRDLRWTLEGYENVQETGVVTNPAIADVDLSLASTTQFLDQLEELGMNAFLGIPGY